MLKATQVAPVVVLALSVCVFAQTVIQPDRAPKVKRRSSKPTVTGVPRFRAGMRGAPGTAAPVETADVSVTGGTGDDTALGIDPRTGSLPIPGMANGLGVKRGTPIRVKLTKSVDSGHAQNGDTVEGVLAAPLGATAAGAPVKLTVVAAAAAGRLASAGEVSIQVVSVDGKTILSNVITAEGEQGKSLSADGAPGRGTEAVFAEGSTLELPSA